MFEDQTYTTMQSNNKLSNIHHLSDAEAQDAEKYRIVSTAQEIAVASVSTLNDAIVAIEEEVKYVANQVSHVVQDALETDKQDEQIAEG